MTDEKPSRSQQKRIAAQKGEPMLTCESIIGSEELDKREEVFFWKIKYYEIHTAMRGAHKGIARLKKQTKTLKQSINTMNIRYNAELGRFHTGLLEFQYKADQRQMENDYLRRQLEDITSQRDGAVRDANRYLAEIEAASQYVDIEIVRAEGLEQAVKICKEERDRYLARKSELEKEIKS